MLAKPVALGKLKADAIRKYQAQGFISPVPKVPKPSTESKTSTKPLKIETDEISSLFGIEPEQIVVTSSKSKVTTPTTNPTAQTKTDSSSNVTGKRKQAEPTSSPSTSKGAGKENQAAEKSGKKSIKMVANGSPSSSSSDGEKERKGKNAKRKQQNKKKEESTDNETSESEGNQTSESEPEAEGISIKTLCSDKDLVIRVQRGLFNEYVSLMMKTENGTPDIMKIRDAKPIVTAICPILDRPENRNVLKLFCKQQFQEVLRDPETKSRLELLNQRKIENSNTVTNNVNNDQKTTTIEKKPPQEPKSILKKKKTILESIKDEDVEDDDDDDDENDDVTSEGKREQERESDKDEKVEGGGEKKVAFDLDEAANSGIPRKTFNEKRDENRLRNELEKLTPQELREAIVILVGKRNKDKRNRKNVKTVLKVILRMYGLNLLPLLNIFLMKTSEDGARILKNLRSNVEGFINDKVVAESFKDGVEQQQLKQMKREKKKVKLTPLNAAIGSDTDFSQ